KWVGKCASKSSKNELVLTEPCDVGGISSGGVILDNCFRWGRMRTIYEFM
ncbi:hypothetical protein TorRG33x02_327160, partial [Trema orientale]